MSTRHHEKDEEGRYGYDFLCRGECEVVFHTHMQQQQHRILNIENIRQL